MRRTPLARQPLTGDDVEPFDHRNLGFKPEDLREYARAAKLDVIACERLTRERRPPHFEVLSLLARKP